MFPAHPFASSLCPTLTFGVFTSSTDLRGPTVFGLTEQRQTRSPKALLTLHLQHLQPLPPFQIVASTCMQDKHECPAPRPSQNKNKASKALFMFQGPPEIRLRLGFCRITIWALSSSPCGVLTPWLAFPAWVPRILAQGMPMEKLEQSQAIVSTMPVIRNVSSPLTTQGPCSPSWVAPPGTNILSQCTKHLQEENLKNTYAQKN